MDDTVNDKIKRVLVSGMYKFSRPPSAVAREMGEPDNEALPQDPMVESPEPQTPVNGPVLAQEETVEQSLTKPVAIDGDTFVFNRNVYRLKGVDTPELKQPHGESARARLERLLQTGEIEIEEVEKDKYGRTIANVRVGGKDIDVQMVESGDAWHYEQEETDKTEALRQAQEIARKEGRGLFGDADSALTEPRNFRKTAMSDYERERWEQTRARMHKQMESVWTPEAIKASVERTAERHSTEAATDKEIAPVRNIASAVAFIGGIGFQHEARGMRVEDIPVYELNRVIHRMSDTFGYTAEDFRNAGHKDPYEAARKYIKTAMDIVRTEERKQKAFKNLSYEEQQEIMRDAYGDRTYSMDEIKRHMEAATIRGAVELAFLNGASAETISTGVMMALSEFQGEDEHRHRLAQMEPGQARMAAGLAGAIRAQYDGNFAAKGLISLWNSTEAVVNNFGAVLSGEAFGTPSEERVLDLLAQQVEDTIIDNSDSFLGEVSTVVGSSLPSMALLLVPKVGVAVYAANAYADMSRVPVLEDWHNAEPWKVEAAKVTYALAAPWIEKAALGMAMKPVSGLMKAASPKLAGWLSTETLRMSLANSQVQTAAAKIAKGLTLTGKRSFVSGIAEVPEEAATQAVSTLGGMFVDPTTAEGKKLYGLERLSDDVIEAAWMAIKTGPFMTLPFAGMGVSMDAFGLSSAINNTYNLLDPKTRPNILEYQQQVINAHAKLDAKTRAETLGGLNEQEVSTFFVSSRESREKILEGTTDKSKKKWLKELDTYIRIEEDYSKGKKPIFGSQDSVVAPRTGVQKNDAARGIEDAANIPFDETKQEEESAANEKAPAEEVKTTEEANTAEEVKTEPETPVVETAKEAPAVEVVEQKTAQPEAKQVEEKKEAPKQPAKRRRKTPQKSTRDVDTATLAEDFIFGKALPKKEEVSEGETEENNARFSIEDIVHPLSVELRVAHGEKLDDGTPVNHQLVNVFKGALKEEAETGVGILDVFSAVYGRKLLDAMADPENHKELLDDPVAWAEATIDNLVGLAIRQKNGDEDAMDALERAYIGDAAFERYATKTGRVDEHPRLRQFAEFSKKWLRSIFGKNAEIYFFEDLANSQDPEHISAYNDFVNSNGRINAFLDINSGNVYVSKNANPVKVLHEVFGHATWQWMKKNDATGFAKLKELALNAPQWIKDKVERNYVKAPESINTKEDEELMDYYLDEVFAHLMEAKYANKVDTLFNTVEDKAWYEKAWEILTKAIRKAWKAIMGEETTSTPDELLTSLSERFFGYSGIFIGDDAKSDGVRFSVVDYDGPNAKSDDEIDPVTGMNAIETMFAKYSSDFPIEDRLELNKHGVVTLPSQSDTEREGSNKADKEKDLVEKMARGISGLTTWRGDNGEKRDINVRIGNPATWQRGSTEDNPFSLKTEQEGFEAVVRKAFTALGLNYDYEQLPIRYRAEAKKEGEQPVIYGYDSVAEEKLDDLVKSTSGKEREVMAALVQIVPVFTAHPAKSRIYFSDEDVAEMQGHLNDAHKALGRFKEGSKRHRELLEKITAWDRVVALATTNSAGFLPVKDTLGSYIAMLAPSSWRIGRQDTDLTASDFEGYGVSQDIGVTQSEWITTLPAILREQTFDEPMEVALNMKALVKYYHSMQEFIGTTWERIKTHPNAYFIKAFSEMMKDVVAAKKRAEEEFRLERDKTYMFHLMARKGLSEEQARKIAFNPSRKRTSLVDEIYRRMEKHYARTDKEYDESLGKKKKLSPLKALELEYGKDGVPVITIIRRLEKDDLDRELAKTDPKRAPMTDAQRKELEDALTKTTNELKNKRFPIKNKALSEPKRDAVLAYNAAYAEMIEGYKKARENGRIYADTDTYSDLVVARQKLKDAMFFASTRGASEGKRIIEVATAEVVKAEKRNKAASNGEPRGPSELLEVIHAAIRKYNDADRRDKELLAEEKSKRAKKTAQRPASKNVEKTEAQREAEFVAGLPDTAMRFHRRLKAAEERLLASEDASAPVSESLTPERISILAENLRQMTIDAYAQIAELNLFNSKTGKRSKAIDYKSIPAELKKRLERNAKAGANKIEEYRIVDKYLSEFKKTPGTVTRDWVGLYPELTKIHALRIGAMIDRQMDGIVALRKMLEAVRRPKSRRYSVNDAPAPEVIPDHKKRSMFRAIDLATALVIRMRTFNVESFSDKECRFVARQIDPYIGGESLEITVAAAKIIAEAVRAKGETSGMSTEEINDYVTNLVANTPMDIVAKLSEAVRTIRTDTWRSVAEDYRRKTERMEVTGRNIDEVLKSGELWKIGVLTKGKKSNLYADDGSSDQDRLRVDAYRGLANKVYNYMFIESDARPIRSNYKTSEEYDKAIESWRASRKDTSGEAKIDMVAKYRNTLSWLYGKYATDGWFRLHFKEGVPNQVRRLVAQMKAYADTIEDVNAYAKKIETLLRQNEQTVTLKGVLGHIRDMLSKFEGELNPRVAMDKRKISPVTYEQLRAMYEGLSAVSEEELLKKIDDKKLSPLERRKKIDDLKKEVLTNKIEEVSKKIAEAEASYKGLNAKTGGSDAEVKANKTKALMELARQTGYSVVLPYLRMNHRLVDTMLPEASHEEAAMSELQHIYNYANKLAAEGAEEIENHIKEKVDEVADFVSKVKSVLDKGRTGDVDISSEARSAFSDAARKFINLATGGFALKQKLDDMLRFCPKSEKRALTQLFDEFVNTPVSSAESNMSKYTARYREWLNEAILRVYGGSKTSDTLPILAMLNATVDEFKKFSTNGKTPITRARLAAQVAMLSQEDVQAPIIELENKLKTGEVVWDKSGLVGNDKNARVLTENERALITRLRKLPEMIEALRTISDGKDLKLIDEFVSHYAEIAPELDAVAMNITGMPVTMDSPRYFPVRRASEYRIGHLNQDSRVIGNVPDFLSPRESVVADIAEDKDIFTIFLDQAKKNAHFMAFGPLHYRLTTLFENGEWVHLTRRVLGNDGAVALKNHIQDICSPRLLQIDNSEENSFWTMAKKWTGISLLGGNVLVALKQVTSISAFAHEIGWSNLAKAVLQNPFSPEVAAIRKEIFDSPEAKLRWGSVWNDIQDDMLTRPDKSAKTATAVAFYMVLQRYGDLAASWIVAPGVFLANYNSLRSNINPETGNPFTDEEARVRAREMVFDMIEKTQQTSRVSNMSNLQRRGQAMAQLWTQFMSSTQLFFAAEVRALRDVAANPKEMDNWRKLSGILISNHILMPSFLWGLETAARWALQDDEPEEEDLIQLVKMMATGPLSGFVLLGSILSNDRYGDVSAPTVSFAGRISKNLYKIGEHTVTGELQEVPEDFDKLLRALIPFYRDTRKVTDTYIFDE